MTIKEFAEKYNIPYNVAYNATYNVKPQTTWMHDRDYPEKELKAELVSILEDREHRLRRNLARTTMLLTKLRS